MTTNIDDCFEDERSRALAKEAYEVIKSMDDHEERWSEDTIDILMRMALLNKGFVKILGEIPEGDMERLHCILGTLTSYYSNKGNLGHYSEEAHEKYHKKYGVGEGK